MKRNDSYYDNLQVYLSSRQKSSNNKSTRMLSQEDQRPIAHKKSSQGQRPIDQAVAQFKNAVQKKPLDSVRTNFDSARAVINMHQR